MPLLPLALGTALTAALSGCGGGGGPAPLDAPPPGSAQCISGRLGQGVTYGDERFTNSADVPVTINSAGLRRPRRLKLLGAIAVPGKYVVGTWDTWPPVITGYPQQEREWTHREPASGYRIRPGGIVNIVIGVAATADPGGRSPGLLIRYHDANGSYVLEDDVAIIVSTRSRGCP